MTLSVTQLETLLAHLQELQSRLRHDRRPDEAPLLEEDALVALAGKGEFPLPSPLTIGSLKETVTRKIENARLLLERARVHKALPQDVQAASDHEDMFVEVGLLPQQQAGNASTQQ